MASCSWLNCTRCGVRAKASADEDDIDWTCFCHLTLSQEHGTPLLTDKGAILRTSKYLEHLPSRYPPSNPPSSAHYGGKVADVGTWSHPDLRIIQLTKWLSRLLVR